MTSGDTLILDGPSDSRRVLLLAHGAGQGASSPFMAALAEGIPNAGIRVVRFNFPYMDRAIRS